MYIVNDSKHSITTRIRHELSSRALPHDMFVEACRLDGYDKTIPDTFQRLTIDSFTIYFCIFEAGLFCTQRERLY